MHTVSVHRVVAGNEGSSRFKRGAMRRLTKSEIEDFAGLEKIW